MDAAVKQIVERLGLRPHPEGGFFREVYRSSVELAHPGVPAQHDNQRCGGSLIYFLLGSGDFSAFHRVCWTDEIWHLYSGGPIELHLIEPGGRYEQRLLASDLANGEPTTVVPAGWWQAARLGSCCTFGFGGCTVAPGFEVADFEMPARGELLARYPQHAEIIESLTRA